MRGATGASVPVLADASTTAHGSWRDLRLRLISAGVLAPLGLACLLNGGWVLAGLVILAMIGIGVEWAGLTRTPRASISHAMLLAWPGLSLLTAIGIDWMTGLRLLVAGFLVGPWRGSGIVLVGLGGLALIWLRGMTGAGAASLLFVVLAVWASDSMAYLVGRALGGPKLAPRISPGKTWSGAAGGLLGAMLAGGIVAACSLSLGAAPGLLERILRGVLFGGVLGVAAQAGDLAESAFKRRCGAKDSGRLIPGHGGLLDRLDGLMAAAPVAALLSLGCGTGQAFWQFDPLHLGAVGIGERHLQSGWLEGIIAARDKHP